MDDIFDSYCVSATSATNPAELAPTTASYSMTPILTSPSVSTQAFEPMMHMDLLACENGSRASASKSDSVNSTTPGPVIALGVLFCLSMLLLAMVTIGWVYTCLVMKKRDTERVMQHLRGKKIEASWRSLI